MSDIDRELEEICKGSNSTKRYYKGIGMEKFYQQHQKKSLVKYLLPYLRHPRLKNYQLMENHNKTEMIPNKTYIKYIDIDNVFADHFIGKHIKAGGILIGCGKMMGENFVNKDKPTEWTHLMLKFDPSVIVDRKGNVVRGRLEVRTFVICMNKNYIFYKNFENDRRLIMQRQMDKIEVKLKDKYGNIIQ